MTTENIKLEIELTPVQAAQAKANALRQTVQSLEWDQSRVKERAISVAKSRIDRFFDTTEQGITLRAKRIEYHTASEALKQAEDAAALTRQGKWPVGTKLARWERAPRPNGDGKGKWYTREEILALPQRYRITTDRGVLEVVTSDTVHPDNMGKYARAGVGEFIIRALRSNGLPGKTYTRIGFDPGEDCLWAPVGVDLDAERNAALREAEAKAKADAQAAKEKFAADAADVFGL